MHASALVAGDQVSAARFQIETHALIRPRSRTLERVHHPARVSDVHARDVVASSTRDVDEITVDAPFNVRHAAAARAPTQRATAADA